LYADFHQGAGIGKAGILQEKSNKSFFLLLEVIKIFSQPKRFPAFNVIA
jgi:hypothetical protein